VPKGVFDVVAKNPKKQHVASDMQYVGVQEHARKKGLQPFASDYVFWNSPISIENVIL
jgi:hypothetical protein